MVDTPHLTIPAEFKVIHQPMPALAEIDPKPLEVPLPQKILEYAELESEDWARQARKRRARALYAECQNWDIVFNMLQYEDTPIND